MHLNFKNENTCRSLKSRSYSKTESAVCEDITSNIASRALMQMCQINLFQCTTDIGI